MELSRRQGLLWATAVLGFVGALLLLRLSAFGIWDPWELAQADRARQLAAGDSVSLERPPLPAWLVAAGFHTFGIREWAGRLPIALAGLATVAIAYWLVARFAGRRAGVYAALVTGTTPLFLFNARQMMGEAAAFGTQALVATTAASAVFAAGRFGRAPRRPWLTTGLWLAALAGSVALAVMAQGALLGAVPPLLAVAVAAGLDGVLLRGREQRRACVAGWAVVAMAAIVTALVVEAVVADRAGYSPWLGGQPQGGDPPTFDAVLEQVFHSFAPWSALALLAVGRLLWPSEERATAPQLAFAHAAVDGGEPRGDNPHHAADPQPSTAADANAPTADASSDDSAPEESSSGAHPRERPLRAIVVLWIAFAYGALTVYLSRYGLAPWSAVVPLGAAIALMLRDVERSRQGWWGAGVVCLLFTVLLVRDYGLYPGSPTDGLALDSVQVPEEFNPKNAWAAAMGLFAATCFVAFGAASNGPLALRAPYQWLRRQWNRGRPFRIWLGIVAVVLGLMLLFGASCHALGMRLPFSTIVIRTGQKLAFVPLALPALVAAAQLVLFGARRLGAHRLVPVLAAGALVGAYAAQGYLPSLSAHFSPREIYDTYNTLAADDEPLGEYDVGSRAAAYYAQGELEELDGEDAVLEFLQQPNRQWAVFPTDQLPSVNRAFRRRTGRHLFVPDASSARVVLVTDEPLEGRANHNFVARFVRDEAPEVQHEVGARYEDKIELIGYDLRLPHDGYVGAGESFTVTWYWRCLKRVSGAWKVFLHIDGQGLRLNGDHHPVDGKYPIRLWDEGDVVIDRQTLDVPANYRSGGYRFMIGLYRGDRRLEVVDGPADDSNRVRAGVLRIR